MALTDKLSNLASCIRSITGKSEGLTLDGMVEALDQFSVEVEYLRREQSSNTIEYGVATKLLTTGEISSSVVKKGELVAFEATLENIRLTNSGIPLFSLPWVPSHDGTFITSYEYDNGTTLHSGGGTVHLYAQDSTVYSYTYEGARQPITKMSISGYYYTTV
jgi:hypothetical protein